MIFGPRWPTWCGRRTPVSAHKGRTVAELLDNSDGLAREALLDISADRAPGMVRGWPQLMQSAAELWAVLPPDRMVSATGDPIAILAAMSRAAARGLAVGHWPGRGPRDEAWQQSASNFVHAGACFRNSLWHPKQDRPTARSTQSQPEPRYCTPCMSPHTPQRSPSPGISVTFNIAWKLARGDGNPWLSDLRRWRSSRPGA
jgi:hypothetical protein